MMVFFFLRMEVSFRVCAVAQKIAQSQFLGHAVAALAHELNARFLAQGNNRRGQKNYKTRKKTTKLGEP